MKIEKYNRASALSYAREYALKRNPAYYDFSSLGGGIILGTAKPIIKARGSANADSVMNTSSMLLNMVKNKDLFSDREVK